MIMKTIFWVEWKNLVSNPLNLTILFFFFGIGVYSIRYGTNVSQKQLIIIDSLQTAYSSDINSSIQKFRSDTSTKQGKIDYNNITEPSSVNYLIKPVAIFQPNSFSALSIGQRDVLPFYKQISSEKSFTQAYASEISNPEVLALGNFDLSFVMVYLLPLLLIALSYNVLSQEKEQGTYSLLALQSSNPRRIIFYKLLFRILVLSFLTLVLNSYAFYVTSKVIPANGVDVFTWLIVLACYLFFWSAVCYLLISLERSSIVTAFYIAGCWIFLVIVLPSILNFYINIAYPIGIKANMASEQRKIEEDVWSIKPKRLIDNFYEHHPEYKTGNLADTLQYSPRRFVAYYDELERRLSPIASVYADKIKCRSQLLSTISDFIPPLKTQKMLNQIGHSDLQTFMDFDQSIIRFHKEWQSFIYRFIFNDRKLRQADYRSIPAYNLDAISTKYSNVLAGSAQLIILSLLLITLTIYIQNKFDNP